MDGMEVGNGCSEVTEDPTWREQDRRISELEDIIAFQTRKAKKTKPGWTRKLMKRFRYNFRCSILINPLKQVNPAIVWNILRHYESRVTVKNHWISDDSSSSSSSSSPSSKIWVGAVAEFRDFMNVKPAARHLEHVTNVKVITFTKYITLLLMGERLNHKGKKELTEIVISTPLHGRSLESFMDHLQQFKALLNLFGKTLDISIDANDSGDVIAVVTYRTQFQAYAARAALHGMNFHPIGLLNVAVTVTERGQRYDNYVKKRFKEAIHEKRLKDFSNFNYSQFHDHLYSSFISLNAFFLTDELLSRSTETSHERKLA